MTQTFLRISRGGEGLSAKERALLARRLIKSLDAGRDAGAEGAWERESRRRIREIKAGKAKGRPAEEVFAEIRAQYT